MCGERRAGESEEDWDRRRGFCFVCGGVPVLNDRVCTTRSFTEFHLHVCLQPTVANVLLQLELPVPPRSCVPARTSRRGVSRPSGAEGVRAQLRAAQLKTFRAPER
jgi:hypothetical protein